MSREQLPIRKTTSWWALVGIAIIAGAAAWYVHYVARGIALIYDAVDSQSAATATQATERVSLADSLPPLHIPSLEVYTPHGPWVYASKNHALPASYQPRDLVSTSLPFSSADSEAKLAARIVTPLTKLFADAKAAGHDLIISSAYRSVTAQQKMYDSFVAQKGKALADQYVSPPGSSEHHTGLAVDINDDTPLCRSKPEKCSLGGYSAQWLAEHAPSYGFIIRYPAGTQPITGIDYEPWHLRYVGVVLARQLTGADMTLDEFISQVAPGLTR